MATPQIQVFAATADLCQAVGMYLMAQHKKFTPTATSPRFVVAVSGGSVPKFVKGALHPYMQSTDWSKWTFVFADERCVPLEDADSNYGLCKTEFLDHLKPAPEVIHINPALIETPHKMADDYEARMPPVVHAAILGMGPDGHTCSLFPDHPLVTNATQRRIVSLTDSPKPPPSRISFSLHEIKHNCESILFLVTGASKADNVLQVFQHMPSTSVPASLAVPVNVNHSLVWFMDQPAAALLSAEILSKFRPSA